MASVIRTWKQSNGVQIDEVEYDGDAHAFTVSVNGKHLTTMYADTPGQSSDMRACLDDGDDVREWEDGHGVSIEMLMMGMMDDLIIEER